LALAAACAGDADVAPVANIREYGGEIGITANDRPTQSSLFVSAPTNAFPVAARAHLSAHVNS
jgi:hypothetical protein